MYKSNHEIAMELRADVQRLTSANAEFFTALVELRNSFRDCIGGEAFSEFEASNPGVILANEAIAKMRGESA